jgi:glycerophosphoryl diester phosphodiesterase
MKILHRTKNVLKKEKIEKCREYTLMRLGHNSHIKQIKGKHFCEEDFKFKEFIQGRSIAIVGPAIPETFVADEINSFDLVVRTNFPVGNSLPTEIYGRYPDISYNMIDTPLSTNIDLSEFSNSDDIKFTIFNDENIVKEYKKITKNVTIITRKYFDCTGIFWSGFPMAVQRIIYDLLHFSPLKIKIFGVNFYTSKILSHKNYNGYENSAFPIRLFRCHDPISNFLFCKNLYENNFISSDKTGVNILQLNRYDYSELANEIIGNVYLNTDACVENQKSS